jgi:hypothetical protein
MEFQAVAELEGRHADDDGGGMIDGDPISAGPRRIRG